MGAVLVHLDAGGRLLLGVGVAAEVVAALEDQYLQPELRGAPLGDGEAEEPAADDQQIWEVGTCLGGVLLGHEGALLMMGGASFTWR